MEKGAPSHSLSHVIISIFSSLPTIFIPFSLLPRHHHQPVWVESLAQMFNLPSPPAAHCFASIHRSTTTLSPRSQSQSQCQFPLPFLSTPQPLALTPFRSHRTHRRHLPLRAFDSPSSSDPKTKQQEQDGAAINNQSVTISDEDYPSGEFQFEPITGWRSFLVKLKMLVAFPWERVRKGSVLTMKLRGQVHFTIFLISIFWSILCNGIGIEFS